MARLQGAYGLLQGGFKGAVDGHDLAGGLHLGAETAVAGGELVEGPPGNLDHAVVQGGFEGGPGLAGDGVGDPVQGLAHGDLGGDPSDGVAGGLAGEGRAAADAGIDLDDVVGASVDGGLAEGLGDEGPGGEGELDVATPFDAQGPDDVQAGGAEHLVVAVGEGLARGDDDAIAGVDAHGVDVFHVADGDAVVGGVAHHLVLDLLPALQVTLDEDLVDGAGSDATGGDGCELLPGAGDAAPGAAQGVGGPDHQGKAEFVLHCKGVFDSLDGGAGRGGLADVLEELLEQFAVLRLTDGLQGSAEHADVEFVEDSGVGQLDGEVEAGLTAEGREDAVGALLFDDAGDYFQGEGFDVDDVGDVFVGHDGGGVGVDEDGDDALFAEGLACLGAGVVEFGGLTDDNGPGAYDKDLGGFGGHVN